MNTTKDTSFQNVEFIECRLIGIHFEDCSNFGLQISFDKCTLDYSTFNQMNLKKIDFKGCILYEVDFTESDCNDSTFEKCDLNRAIFSNTNLTGADFRSAYNYEIDPRNNQIKEAKFSFPEIVGLLKSFDIRIESQY
jgi:uncharacterized protein YjbI with pentapeptide repeats